MNPRTARLAAATAALLVLGAAPAIGDDGVSTTTASEGPPSTGVPRHVLPRDLHGLTAVNTLGSQLKAVAAQNDLSAARLTRDGIQGLITVRIFDRIVPVEA